MKKYYLAIITLIPLYACAPAGITNVKSNYSRFESYEVSENYQAVYRKVARRVPQCYSNKDITPQTNLYNDIKMGEFSVGNVFGTFLVVEMISLGKNKTRVDIYVGTLTWNSSVEKVKGWIDGTYDEC